MRILAVFFLWLGLLVSAIPDAHANRRVAFVVGNGAYKHVAPLPNPSHDAQAMASLLRNAGFEVVEGEDLSRDGMTAKLREFALKTQGADIALFFYAGHGISVNGKNYLIPVDADLKSEVDIKFGAAIDVDVALDQTMADAKVKLIFLDACRDNPFAARVRSAARTRSVVVGNGLAEMTTGEGTLIAFATGPGQTALDGNAGQNSPFTRALLKHIATPGVEIQQALTQVRAQVNDETRKQQLPWGHTNLIGAVYLNPTTNTAALAPQTSSSSSTAAVPNTDVELEFWRSIKDSNKVEEFNAYLLNYPNGQFKSLALARIAALQSQKNTVTASTTRSTPEMAVARDADIFSAEASIVTESDLLLDPQARRDIQSRLTLLGFSTAADGVFGDGTRLALMRWQTARGYPKSGYLNKLQQQALFKESASAATRPNTVTEQPRPQYQQQRPQQQQAAPPVAHDSFIGGIIGGAIGGAIGRR
jgi:Caspase domain/Putative peptidoglycan binding domain